MEPSTRKQSEDKNFASDIRVDWVRMAESVQGYNFVIVGKFFNNGSRISEAWRKAHHEELAVEPEGPPERVMTAEEQRTLLNTDHETERCACAAFGHATPTLRSAYVGRMGRPEWRLRTDQSARIIERLNSTVHLFFHFSQNFKSTENQQIKHTLFLTGNQHQSHKPRRGFSRANAPCSARRSSRRSSKHNPMPSRQPRRRRLSCCPNPSGQSPSGSSRFWTC